MKLTTLKALNRLSLALALAVFITAVVPVPAKAAETSGWIELLEFSSIRTDGENWFTMGSTGSVTIQVQGEKRLRKVDILLWNPTSQRPTSATCTAGGKTNTLEILAIGSNLTRIVGYIPDAFYESIRIDLKKSASTSQTYEVLSWKVTPIGVQEFVADASVYLESYGTFGTYSTNYNIPLWYDASDYVSDGAPWLARIEVRDWEKFDQLSIWGSATSASIESIRASIDTTALDYQVNYIDAESYESFYDGDPTASETAQWGKYLFNITIDLSNVDRSLTTSLLVVYLTGSYDLTVRAYFNCQYVNGSVTTADTTNVSWWQRFTTFFNGLFGDNSNDGDQYASEMEEQAVQMEQAVDQMNQVQRPNPNSINVSLSGLTDPNATQQISFLMTTVLNEQMVMTPLLILLTLALASFVIFGKRG